MILFLVSTIALHAQASKDWKPVRRGTGVDRCKRRSRCTRNHCLLSRL